MNLTVPDVAGRDLLRFQTPPRVRQSPPGASLVKERDIWAAKEAAYQSGKSLPSHAEQIAPEGTAARDTILSIMIEVPTYGTPEQQLGIAEDALRAVQISFHSRTKGWLVTDTDFIELNPKQN